jgi:hypothetical protein
MASFFATHSASFSIYLALLKALMPIPKMASFGKNAPVLPALSLPKGSMGKHLVFSSSRLPVFSSSRSLSRASRGIPVFPFSHRPVLRRPLLQPLFPNQKSQI